MPVRRPLIFARTARGDAQVRRPEQSLPLHFARLLLLFEDPQSVHELRRMIDEPWLPEALIELERRRLIERLGARRPDADHSIAPAADDPNALSALSLPAGAPARRVTSPLAVRRDRVREMFLRQLGSVGADMGRRIDQCRSLEELDELMPQVEALVEAIAGDDALARFRAHLARDH